MIMKRWALWLPFLFSASAWADLRYTVVPEPAGKTVRVTLEVEANADTTEFRIPAWCPGYYVILDYQKKLSDVQVTDRSGKRLNLTPTDDRGWRVAAPKGETLRISYRVLGDDGGLGFFGVSVHPHTAFINGPAAFMYPEGRLNEPVKVKFELPDKWEVATAMDSDASGHWLAADYDELLDHPIQLGIFERRTFIVEGVPFEAVFVSENTTFRPNLDEEARQLAQLSVPALKMMGGAPFKRYVYLIHLAIGNFSGGLEHRASTLIAVPNMGRLRLHELAAHEFYHVWNIKHIRHKALGPFDYSKAVRTRSLWFSEGVTDYYAHLHVHQSGLRDAAGMLQLLSDQIDELQSSRSRLTHTIEEASLAAWENGSFGVGDLSYYTKGSIAGLVFDAAIRGATGGKRSLDDVMRSLFAKHRLPNPGFEEEDLLKAINEAAGQDLSDLYRRVIQSKEEVPYDELMAIGLRVRLPGVPANGLGYELKDGVVSEVDAEVSQQGLRRGDRIVTVNGSQLASGCFAAARDQETYDVEVLREGRIVKIGLKPVKVRTLRPTVEFDPYADARAIAQRDRWLRTPK